MQGVMDTARLAMLESGAYPTGSHFRVSKLASAGGKGSSDGGSDEGGWDLQEGKAGPCLTREAPWQPL